MTAADAARWNAKHSEFFVVTWSVKTSRSVMVGKSHTTIEAALASAARCDKRRPEWMHFVDVVRPRAA